MRNSLLSLALPAVLLATAATAAGGVPAMPRVVHTLPAPAPAGGYTSLHHLKMSGRTAGYVLGKVTCDPECSAELTVTEYAGVSRREVFTSTRFILSAKMSSELLAWQVIGEGIDHPLWAAERGGEAKQLTASSWLDAYDASGKHVAWGHYEEDTFDYDIFRDGKSITTQPEPEPALFGADPRISGNSVVFGVVGATEQVALFRRGRRNYVSLPALLPDQTLTDLQVGENGDKVIMLKRDYVDEQTHHELSIYDVSRKQTKTILLGAPPIQGLPYDGGWHYVWIQGTNEGPHAQLTDVETGATVDIEDGLGDGAGTAGNISDGLFSYTIAGAGPRLSDVTTGDVEIIGYSGGENGLANSGRNVAWVGYDASGVTVTLRISYPADEAVAAIVDATKGYDGLPGSMKTRLLKPLKTTLRALARGDFVSAYQALHGFLDAVGAAQGQGLSAEQAAALAGAAQLVIDALPT